MTGEEGAEVQEQLQSQAWMHIKGTGPYHVLWLADVADDAEEEPTVVYQGPDCRIWTRKLSNFYVRMRRTNSG